MIRRGRNEQFDREREDFEAKYAMRPERLKRMCECGHEYGDHAWGTACGDHKCLCENFKEAMVAA